MLCFLDDLLLLPFAFMALFLYCQSVYGRFSVHSFDKLYNNESWSSDSSDANLWQNPLTVPVCFIANTSIWCQFICNCQSKWYTILLYQCFCLIPVTVLQVNICVYKNVLLFNVLIHHLHSFITFKVILIAWHSFTFLINTNTICLNNQKYFRKLWSFCCPFITAT